MKRLAPLVALLIVSVSSTLASDATAASASAASGAPFQATFSAPSDVTLDCCYTLIGLDSTVTTIPRLGRVTASGWIEWCGSSPYSPCPERNGTTLSLEFTTASGDTLTLGGHNPIGDPSLTWTVTDGSGRFANASGSGSYTYDTEPGNSGWMTTISLSGTLSVR